MEILFSDEFRKEFKRIKDKSMRLRILKQIKKLAKSPKSGKPLRHALKNHRTLRINPFRIVYRLDKDKIVINCFDHRESVYR